VNTFKAWEPKQFLLSEDEAKAECWVAAQIYLDTNHFLYDGDTIHSVVVESTWHIMRMMYCGPNPTPLITQE